jgi:hypothetical protein
MSEFAKVKLQGSSEILLRKTIGAISEFKTKSIIKF